MANTIGGSVVWDLDVDMKKFNAGVDDARGKISTLATNIDNSFSGMAKSISSNLEKASQSLNQAGNNLTLFGAAPTAALGLSVKAAIDFEDQMANVAKTVGLAGKDLKDVSNEFLNLSRNTRTSIPDLVDIATIGGQIGIAKKDIVAFTDATNKATVALGDEFGSAEQTAKAIGTLGTQFGLINRLGVDQTVQRIGSALNELGASGLATADYVTNFSNRLGGTSNLLKISTQDTLGLSAAVQETGLRVEASSTAIQRTLLTMAKSGENFGKVIGLTGKKADDFAQLMKTDVNKAFLVFLEELGKMSAEDALKVLDDLQLSSALTSQTLLTLRDKTALIADKQALANKAFADGTSLLNEYNVKNNTTQAQVEKFSNNIRVLGITIGNALLPAINDIISSIVPVVQNFAKFAADNPKLVTGILVVGSSFTALGLVLKGFAVIFSGLSTIIPIVANIIPAIGGIGKAIFALQPAFAFLLANPIVLVIGAIIAVVTLLAFAWSKNWGDIQGKTKTAIDFISGIFTGFIGFLGNFFKAFGDAFTVAWNGIASVTTTIWNGIKFFLVGIFEGILFSITSNLNAIKAIVTGVLTVTIAILRGLGSLISFAILQPFENARNALSGIVSNMFNFVRGAWDSIANFFSSIGRRIVDGITQPFREARQEVDRIAQSIKDAANKINPFHRNSPSLVDNVQRGIGLIKDQYSSLSDLSFPTISASVAPADFVDPIDQTVRGISPAESITDNSSRSEVNVNIQEVRTNQDVDAISREIGFKLATV